MQAIRVIDQDFNLLGQTTTYQSYMNELDYNGIGTCELRISLYDPNANKFQIDNIMFASNRTDEAYIIKYKQIELTEDGKSSEVWVIRGYQLKTIINRAIIYPTTGNEYNTIETNSEDAARHYVNTQLISAPTSRRFPRLVLGQSNSRGTVRRHDARYDNLSDYITSILAFDNLGWDIILDIPNQQFVFVILEGNNRSITSSNPIILSTDFRTLKSMQYSVSKIDYYNVAIVGGPGEGINRLVVEVGDTQGYDRREIFLDAREIALNNEDGSPRLQADIIRDLTQYGQEFLMTSQQQQFATGQLQPKINLQFKSNYNLGDVVTIQNKNWSVQLNARITKVRRVIEYGTDLIEHTFDYGAPTLISKINSSLSQLSGEIRR